MNSNSQIVYNSTGDADTLIVSSALQYAQQGQEVNVVADDTDILVLLVYHWKDTMADINFQSEAKCKKKDIMAWKMCDLANQAGAITTSHLISMRGVVVIQHQPSLGRGKQGF